MAGRGPKSELDKLRAELREKYRVPLATRFSEGARTPTVMALTGPDTWCVATRTFPSTADTLCGGVNVRATAFATWGHPDFQPMRWCEACARKHTPLHPSAR